MAMLLDYGQKTVTVAPFKVTATKMVIPVKTQIATNTVTKPLATALKPSPTKTVIPYNLQGSVKVTNLATGISTMEQTKSVATNTPAKQQAVTALVNALQGQAIRASPNFQKVFTTIRTKQTLSAIDKTGLELAPKGTSAIVYDIGQQNTILADAYNAIYGINQQLVGRQTEYQNQISAQTAELAKQAVNYQNTKSQLSSLTSDYQQLQQAYQELQENPPQKDDLLGGIGDFLSKYGLWIALGVGAIILLPSIMRIFERR